MGAPGDGDIAYCPATDGKPPDLVTAIGGTINTGTTLNQATPNLMLPGPLTIPPLGGTAQSYYEILGLENTATGSCQSARMAHRTGALTNSSPGVVQLVSTSPSDTTVTVTVTGKQSGVWAQKTYTLTGTTQVTGGDTFDGGSIIRWECNVQPAGNVTCAVAGQTCAVIYGGAGGPTQPWASNEIKIALANNLGATLGAANCVTQPTQTSSPSGALTFYLATWWSGGDASVALPTGALTSGQIIPYVVQTTLQPGVPPTLTTYMRPSVGLLFTPSVT